MKVVKTYSFNGGREFFDDHHLVELKEIFEVIKSVDASKLKTEVSKEKTMPGEMLYSPVAMNAEFKRLFSERGWKPHKITI